MIKPFSFTGARKIVFGTGSFEKLAEHIEALQGRNPLIVLDKNLAATGFNKKVSDMLSNRSLKVSFFQQAEPEPRLELVDEGAKFALKHKCDLIVGIGGGSAMDLAKAMGSDIARQQDARKLRGAALFQEYKKKMGMVQPEATATPATPAPTQPERQKIPEQ